MSGADERVLLENAVRRFLLDEDAMMEELPSLRCEARGVRIAIAARSRDAFGASCNRRPPRSEGGTVSEMVERVARALFVRDNNESRAQCEWDVPGAYGKGARSSYLSKARAAIAAMREPTDDMLIVGMTHADECNDSGCAACTADHVWGAMIEAALSPDSQCVQQAKEQEGG